MSRWLFVWVGFAGLVTVPQSVEGQEAVRISASFSEASLQEVMSLIADSTGLSYVLGPGTDVSVTARLEGEPWSEALAAVLEAHGLTLTETSPGMLVVRSRAITTEDVPEPLETRTYRLRWQFARDLEDVVLSVLSEDGRVAVSSATNALVVTDRPAVLARVSRLLGQS